MITSIFFLGQLSRGWNASHGGASINCGYGAKHALGHLGLGATSQLIFLK